jgi:cytochrome P450
MPHTKTKNRFPPGPSGSHEEQLATFNSDPFGYLEVLAKEYGSIFNLRLGALGNEDLANVDNNGNWVFLTRPHQIRTMYTADEHTTSGALANAVFFGTNESSVSYIDGKGHRHRRAQLRPNFSGSRDYVALISEVTDRCMAQWPREEPFGLFTELQKLTSEVIVEVICGNLDKADREQLCTLLPKTENAGYTAEEARAADSAVRALVHERMGGYLAKSETLGKYDVLASLLRFAADGDRSLSDYVIRDEIFSLLYTGFSTTANTLAWAFVRILRHEDVYRKLMAELGDRFLHRPLKRDTFIGLSYLEATIMETLRLHPVSALNGVRMVKKPLQVDGYVIPAGSILVHCAYLIQRSPEVYEAPQRFRPERFVDGKVDPYVWGAFGGGDRTCIGQGYSKEEMKVVLAIVLSALQMEASGKIPRAKQQGIFMAPEDNALCVVRKTHH